jgi:hypothetical protein
LNAKSNVVDLTTANVAELTNLYYTNARVYSNVIGLIGDKANVSDLTTANVTELTNLYYTNARVYANVIGLLNAKSNVVDLTTANVAELNNLYYTNARVNAQVEANLRLKANVVDLTTANVVELNNLYYTNARVASNVIALLPTLAGDNIIIAANGRISANLSAVAVNSVVGNLNVSGNVIANNFVSTGPGSGLISSTGNVTVSAIGIVT